MGDIFLIPVYSIYVSHNNDHVLVGGREIL